MSMIVVFEKLMIKFAYFLIKIYNIIWGSAPWGSVYIEHDCGWAAFAKKSSK